MECLVPCVKEGLGAAISFPDLQLELTADISSIALSKIISFSVLPLCTFFFSQHLAVVSHVSLYCSILSTHFKSAVHITRP